MFVGEYERSVDGTGRVALPSAFRDDLGDRCYATREPSGHVSITSIETFRAAADHVMERVRTGELPDSALRDFGVTSTVISIDKQGRITLDDELRSHAGVASGSQVVIAGALSTLQIWRPSRYRTVRGEDGVSQPPRVWADDDETGSGS